MSNSPRHKPRKSVPIGVRTAIVAVVSLALAGGVAESAQAAMPSGPTVTGLTGARASATRLPFQISDRVNASVDVATGNLLVTANGLSLPGVNSTVPVGAAYNSLSTTAGNTSTPAANGWTYNYAGAGNLSTVTGGLVLTQADGQTWKFASISGSQTAFTSPVGLNEGLTGTTSNGIVNGYTLVDVASRAVTQFDANGNPISVTDKNNKKTTTL